MVSPRTVHNLLRDNRWILVVDVRRIPPPGTYEPAVANSLRLPLQEIPARLSKLKQFSCYDIVVVTEDGSEAELARNLLLSHGFRSVYGLEGGIKAWEAQGLPLVTWSPVVGKRPRDIERRAAREAKSPVLAERRKSIL